MWLLHTNGTQKQALIIPKGDGVIGPVSGAAPRSPLLVLLEPCHVRLEDLISIQHYTSLRSFLCHNAHAAGAPAAVREVLVGLVYDRKLLLQERHQTFD